MSPEENANERDMLKRIAQDAAAVYAEIQNNDLRHKLSMLKRCRKRSRHGAPS
jgi:hypothetical protein